MDGSDGSASSRSSTPSAETPCDTDAVRALPDVRKAERARGVPEAELSPELNPDGTPYSGGDTKLDAEALELAEELDRRKQVLTIGPRGWTTSPLGRFVEELTREHDRLTWDLLRADPAIVSAPTRLSTLATDLQQAQTEAGPGARAEFDRVMAEMEVMVAEYDEVIRGATGVEAVVLELQKEQIAGEVSEEHE
ncbi:hypothetical protein JCM8202_001444 [Rhodotorula sphaerocarpa]